MYDFIKIRTKLASPEAYIIDSGLPFVEASRTDTGEIIDRWTARLKNITLLIYSSGLFIIRGSAHKYRNRGGHNYDDFTLSDYYGVVEALGQKIGLDLWDFTIDTLEVGVNIEPLISIKTILDHAFRHKTKSFKDMAVALRGDYRQAEYSDYFVKLYSKGQQFGLQKDVLRFEIKLKADALRRLNIHSLHDTITDEIVSCLKELLLQRFSEIVFIDPTIRAEEMSEKQRAKLLAWQNPRYWDDLHSSPPSKNSYNNQIKILANVVQRHSDRILEKTATIIQRKMDQLSTCSAVPIIEKAGIIRTRQQVKARNLYGKTSTSDIMPEVPQPKKCPISGCDITMQQDNSHFLSPIGVKFYHDNDRIMFDWLKSEYLPKSWWTSPLEDQFREIAHGVRHRDSDRRRSLIKQAERLSNNPTLFPLKKIIDHSLIEKYSVPFVLAQHWGIYQNGK